MTLHISENMNPDGESSENLEHVPDGPAIQSVTFEDLERRLSNLDGKKGMDGKNRPRKMLTFEIVEQRLTELEDFANVPRENYQGKSQEELNSELLKAAKNGESVIGLIEAGADVTTKDEASDDSALHLSAARGMMMLWRPSSIMDWMWTQGEQSRGRR